MARTKAANEVANSAHFKGWLVDCVIQKIDLSSSERFVGSRNGLVVVGEVEKHSLAKPLLAWRDPSPMPVQKVELTFVGVEGRYVLVDDCTRGDG